MLTMYILVLSWLIFVHASRARMVITVKAMSLGMRIGLSSYSDVFLDQVSM